MRAGPCASGPPSPRPRPRAQGVDASTRPETAQHLHTPRASPGASASRSGERQGRTVAPEPLQRVVRASVLEKNMHENVAVVEKHPAALRHALGVARLYALALELAADRVGDGLQMRARLAAA